MAQIINVNLQGTFVMARRSTRYDLGRPRQCNRQFRFGELAQWLSCIECYDVSKAAIAMLTENPATGPMTDAIFGEMMV